MRKFLLTAIVTFTMTGMSAFAFPPPPPPEGEGFPPPPPHQKQMNKADFEKMKQEMDAKKQEFDKRLNLTETQKEQAKAIRLKGHKEIKPILKKINEKRQAIGEIRRSNLSIAEQDKKVEVLKKDIKALKKKADTLRKANMKEFEAILTDTQKKELQKMKKEGELRHKQMRKDRV